MEQHASQERQIESADSANAKTVESTTTVTEENGEIAKETLEVQNLESMIALVSSTMEIPPKEEAQVPCPDDARVLTDDGAADDSTAVEIYSDQKEAPETRDETNESSESKSEFTEFEANELCRDERKTLENDGVEVVAYGDENVASAADNENNPDYMTMDQDMLPDCVNQNCDRSDQTDFQSNEVLSESECNRRSASQEDAEASVVPGENATAEETIVPSETIVPETAEEDSPLPETKRDVAVETREETDPVVPDPKESDEVEIETEAQEEISLYDHAIDAATACAKLEPEASAQNDADEKHQNSEIAASEESLEDIVVEKNEVEDSQRGEEHEKAAIGATALPEKSEATEEKVQKDPEEARNKISTAATDGDESPTASAAREASESDADKDAADSNRPEAFGKRRSVVQDIVDDWTDENNEDPGEVSIQVIQLQDSVEIQLESLLDGANSDAKVIEVAYGEDLRDEEDLPINERSVATVERSEETLVADESHKSVDKPAISREITSCAPPRASVRTPGIPTQDFGSFKHKPQSPRLGLKVPGRHLTSPIVSTAEVAEVLKERIKEKQKDLEVPRGGDIFFVKKIAQRLSNKLSAGSAHPVPGLIPLPAQPARLPAEKQEFKTPESAKEPRNAACADNRELLAILEGDVDPDWSNLKAPVLRDVKSAESVDEHAAPPKLDPLIERELALKQLLELPSIPMRKNAAKKKKTFKPAPSRVEKLNVDKDRSANPVLANEQPIIGDKTSSAVDDENDDDDVVVAPVVCQERARNESAESPQEIRTDESRSGRKRKPTEKAREHEQNTSKRQKVYKGKVSRKLENDVDGSSPLPGSPLIARKESDDSLRSTDVQQKRQAPDGGEIRKKQTQGKAAATIEAKQKSARSDRSETTKYATLTGAKPRQKLLKKGPQPIVKRKLTVRKLVRQRASQKSSGVKSRLTLSSSRKSEARAKSKAQSSPGDAKPKKKTINEIDKLLQDEGVVNLLYDVEQSDKKRRIPITKTQTKVMDMQKVQRELKIRTKLVRNAVLRLRTSGAGTSKVSPRSKRSTGSADFAQQQDKSGEQIKSPRSTLSSPTDFIFPAKIRNAADASIIIRRHSSSSFSSASGSPRVSIDAPERQQQQDPSKLDPAASHLTRSTKRRFSQDDKSKQSGEVRKSKKKAVQRSAVEVDVEVDVDDEVPEEKVILATRSVKRMTESKRSEKTAKRSEAGGVAERSDGSAAGKVVTRSNGSAPSGKVIPKSKKGTKSKVSFGRAPEVDGGEDQPKLADELSACLAAAATALSRAEGVPSRSGGTTANRKLKGNFAKTIETDVTKKQKGELSSQFVNKEINVRWHGNLVQLILTPSSSTKLRNSITIQVMREIRDTLAILRRSEKCRVVLLTSTGGSFCEGLELSGLLHANQDERRARAHEMAVAVKEFIKCLTSFNKPIVAGVQGAASGLGVTMLSLFDLVVASDKATFSTPYAKLGQIPEGAAVLTLTHTLGSAVTSELLLGGRTLTASEALRAGLVTRVLWPDRFQGDLLPSLKAMSEQSSQSMEATKALLRHNLRKKLDAALESESYLLVQHWCSDECQAAIKDYIEGQTH